MEATQQLAPATISPQIIAQLNQVRALVPEDRQLSWLQLAYGKATILKTLTDKEVSLQALLLNYDKLSLLDLQTNIDAYKKGVKELPEIRKGYTRYLDMIYDELMKPEKRAEVWETFTKAKEMYTAKRIAKEEEDEKTNAKAKEAENFKTHIKNEYVRMLAAYQLALSQSIHNAYTMALNDQTLDEAGVQKYISTTEAAMNDIKQADPVKFDYKLHTKEELVEIHKAFTKENPGPDYVSVLGRYKIALRDKFKLYFNDRQNSEGAKTFLQKQLDAQEAEIKKTADNAVAVNQLMSSAAVTTISSAGNGIKELKRKKVIVVKDDDSRWAKLIITTFSANWDKAAEFVRVKKWGNLSVTQMAAALDEAEIVIDGAEYKEEIK